MAFPKSSDSEIIAISKALGDTRYETTCSNIQERNLSNTQGLK